MTVTALDVSLALCTAQARLCLELDEALGTLHGIALRELGLLVELQRRPEGSATLGVLSTALGLSPSSLLRMCLPLERTGLIERAPRRLSLRPAGARVAREARDTAGHAAERALATSSAGERTMLYDLLCTVAARRVPAGAGDVAT